MPEWSAEEREGRGERDSLGMEGVGMVKKWTNWSTGQWTNGQWDPCLFVKSSGCTVSAFLYAHLSI